MDDIHYDICMKCVSGTCAYQVQVILQEISYFVQYLQVLIIL